MVVERYFLSTLPRYLPALRRGTVLQAYFIVFLTLHLPFDPLIVAFPSTTIDDAPL